MNMVHVLSTLVLGGLLGAVLNKYFASPADASLHILLFVLSYIIVGEITGYVINKYNSSAE